MDKIKLAHHLNAIKLCQSNRALEKCIERIFEEGNRNGWDEALKCPKCNTDYDEEILVCKKCGVEE